MARARPHAEVLFERYLRAHGYEWEHEPELGVSSRPDYRVRRSGVEAICEVKQFETRAIREFGEAAGGPVVVPPRLLYDTIRNQLDSAARQLKPLADRDIPLVVVLANPLRATVLLDPPFLFHAMYGGGHWATDGEPTPSIEAWPIPTAAGRDGALTNQHTYIGAVVALFTRRDPTAHFDAPPVPRNDPSPYVHVLDTLSDAAVRLPDQMFDGPSDARWSPDDRNHYRQISGVIRPGGMRDLDA